LKRLLFTSPAPIFFYALANAAQDPYNSPELVSITGIQESKQLILQTAKEEPIRVNPTCTKQTA
jgi:hypothetical protein